MIATSASSWAYLILLLLIYLALEPWFVDFQGGPGGSSLFGLFIEHGPFSVDDDLNLVERHYRYTNANMILIDQFKNLF